MRLRPCSTWRWRWNSSPRRSERLPARWLAAVIGILICYLTGRGLLAPAGEGFIRCPYADYLLTGLLISRGSGVMHDLINAFGNFGRRLLKRI